MAMPMPRMSDTIMFLTRLGETGPPGTCAPSSFVIVPALHGFYQQVDAFLITHDADITNQETPAVLP